MGGRLIAAGFGVLFGFMISWGHFTDPDEIREMLLLQDLYLWKMFAVAVGVAFAGNRVVRGRRAWLTRDRIDWSSSRPAPRHFSGAVVFGLGWAIAASCPAPIAAQLAQGVGWSVFTLVGVGVGAWLFARRSGVDPVVATVAGGASPGEPEPARAS